MTPRERSEGEIAVVGLARSGRAVARLLLADGYPVYASDAGSSPAVNEVAGELTGLSAAVDVGGHDLERIRNAAKVVVSPGIPPDAPPLVAAREAGVRIVSEIEIALGYLTESRVIAVTGTNGKSTTTALIGHILRSLGEDAVDAGNIGTPLSDVALRHDKPGWIALEMSSFQLHDTPGLSPHVGVLTNLGPDHLDRYLTVDDYYADKALLFANAAGSSSWVLNRDDERVLDMASGVRGRRLFFSLRAEADAWYSPDSDELRLLGEKLLARSAFPLLGDHNVANALAASLAVASADARFAEADSRVRIAEALVSFRGLSHRLEVVAERDGIQWINDSKATNVSSARVAIAGMQRPTVLLLGGRHKGEPYSALAEVIAGRVKRILAFGEAGTEIEKDLDGIVPIERLGSDFAIVMRRARENAQPGDAVLLSPACSSYDMFRDYVERGETFAAIARGEQ